MKKNLLRKQRRRKGAAAVELAVCLPPLILLVFAAIEGCSMIFVTQSLSAAAYEGIRVAIKDDGTSAEALALCNQILSDRGVSGTQVRLNPADVQTPARGDLVRIVVRAPCDANSIMPGWFFRGRVLETRVYMVKE